MITAASSATVQTFAALHIFSSFNLSSNYNFNIVARCNSMSNL